MIPNFNFFICGAWEINKYIGKVNTGIQITHPQNDEEADYSKLIESCDNFQYYKLLFHDVWGEHHKIFKYAKWPTIDDIKQIIGIARDIKKRLNNNEIVNLILNCTAGISRSTATTAIIMNYLMGPGHERVIMQEIYEKRPVAAPNPYLLKLADDFLDRGGAICKNYDLSFKLDDDNKTIWL